MQVSNRLHGRHSRKPYRWPLYVALSLALPIITGALPIFAQQENIREEQVPSPSTTPISTASPVSTTTQHKNVSYCNTSNPQQKYDLSVPTDRAKGTVPVVVYVHGGGWSEGNRSDGVADSYAKPLVQKGIAFASVDYRLSQEASYPAQNDDVSCAIQHLRNNATEYGIDPQRIILMGDSAGGQLVALEALKKNNQHIKAVVMLYGVSDLLWQIIEGRGGNALNYLGGYNEKLARQASPVYQDLSQAPPFLLVHGSADITVPVEQSRYFTQQLRNFGREATYLEVVGAEHAFIGTDDPLEAQVKPKILQYIVDHSK